MGKESEYHSPDKGYCASQKKYFYGYKLHSICTAAGVIESLDLTKASVHSLPRQCGDIHFLKYVQELLSNCILTGDKGYIGKEQQINLFETAKIKLEVPLRNNQKEQKPVIPILKKIKKNRNCFFTVVQPVYDTA